MSGAAFPANPDLGAGASATGGTARIYDWVQSTLSGLTMPVLRMALWDTVEEFCTRSSLWRQTLSFTLAAGATTFNCNPVDPHTLAVQVLSVTGITRFQLLRTVGVLDLGDATQARACTVLVSCKPNGLDEATIPGFLTDTWSEALRDGALARLCGMPNKPWTDAKLVAVHGARFRRQMFLAREQARNNGDLPRARFPYFAKGSQAWGAQHVWGQGSDLAFGANILTY